MLMERTGEAYAIDLEVDGQCEGRIFGISPKERLARQLKSTGEAMERLKLVCDAACVIGDTTLAWLIANPNHLLRSPGGNSFAVVVDAATDIAPLSFYDAAVVKAHGIVVMQDGDMPLLFSRKLRRLQPAFVRSLNDDGVSAVEWALFKEVYKGVTDIVTRWLWPVPAFWAVRIFSRVGISPNMVTMTGIMLTVLAGVLFARGEFGAGLAAGWLMTFLDTVDGKLARVTCTSSKFGDKLDHIPDAVHPPLWWACVAYGLLPTSRNADLVQASLVAILVTYALGRVCEVWFKKQFGFNQYLWRRFDTVLRFIIARRNIILLILTAGVLTHRAEQSFYLVAIWSVLTIGLQPIRMFQAFGEIRATGLVQSWMK